MPYDPASSQVRHDLSVKGASLSASGKARQDGMFEPVSITIVHQVGGRDALVNIVVDGPGPALSAHVSLRLRPEDAVALASAIQDVVSHIP